MTPSLDPEQSWYSSPGKPHPCVLALRWTAFRNVEGWPFSARCRPEQKQVLKQRLSEVVQTDKTLSSPFIWKEAPPLTKALAQERLLVPEGLVQDREALSWWSPRDVWGLHWGGEDHLRFRQLSLGFQPQEIESFLSSLESWGQRLGFAWRPGWGWVTADPSHAGSALQVSALLHLPASEASGLWEAMMKTVERQGFSLLPVWAGSRGESDFFWLQSAFSHGRTEQELHSVLVSLIEKITKGEIEARQREAKLKRLDLEDRVGRAWGLLAHARRLSWEETLPALSALRRAPELIIIKESVSDRLDSLFFRLQGAHLRALLASQDGEDVLRSDVLRNILLGGKKNV